MSSCFTEKKNAIMMSPTASARIPKSIRRMSRNFEVQKNASIPEIKIITPMRKICHHWTGDSERTNFGRSIYSGSFKGAFKNLPLKYDSPGRWELTGSLQSASCRINSIAFSISAQCKIV
jgi:hypothetical protein